MEKIAITDFKAHALKLLARVAETKEAIVITKRGRPFVQVMPYVNSGRANTPGKLADALVFENDIVTPLENDMWDACR